MRDDNPLVKRFRGNMLAAVKSGAYTYFLNGDETPIPMECMSKVTIDKRGVSRVRSRSGGKDKTNLTAWIMVGAEIKMGDDGRPHVGKVWALFGFNRI